MAASNLASIMDGLAAAVLGTGLVREAHAWPPGSVAVPSCLVDFPTSVELAATFGRGSDIVELPVLLLVSQTFNKAARDALSAFIAAGATLYGAIEGPHAWGTAHIAVASTTTVVLGASSAAPITYLALKLDVEVAT